MEESFFVCFMVTLDVRLAFLVSLLLNGFLMAVSINFDDWISRLAMSFMTLNALLRENFVVLFLKNILSFS